jgi:TonB family protein
MELAMPAGIKTIIRPAMLACAFSVALIGCIKSKPGEKLPDGTPWPTDAQGSYVEGRAVVFILVSSSGHSQGACLAKSSGNAVLDREALRRFDHKQFKPQMKNGVPIASWARVPVDYSVSDYTMPIRTTSLLGYPMARNQLESCTRQLWIRWRNEKIDP